VYCLDYGLTLRYLGTAALLLIAVGVVRAPVSRVHPNQMPVEIGGIPVMPLQGEFGPSRRSVPPHQDSGRRFGNPIGAGIS